MEQKFKVGDRVEITFNKPIQDKNKKPLLGTVENVDGHCVLVKIDNRKYSCEFYKNELRHEKKEEDSSLIYADIEAAINSLRVKQAQYTCTVYCGNNSSISDDVTF